MTNNNKISLSYPILLAVIASIGGLLFGFNAGIISGALPFLLNSWGGLTEQQSDLILVATLIGATIGALVTIKLSDTYGRRVLIIGVSIIYAIGAMLSGASISVSFLIISRIILGIAMGVSSCIIPLYISEISPAKNRGALVSLFQLMITIGILLSFFSNTAFANEFDPFSWRKMFYLGVIPSLLFFVGTFFLPETPRFLLFQGQVKAGKDVLRKIEQEPIVETTILKIKPYKKHSEIKLWSPVTKRILFIIISIMFIQQFVGINAIIYFTPSLFASIIKTFSPLAITFSIGIINVISSVFAVLLIDRIGRRRLFNFGLSGMFATLLLLGFVFISNSSFAYSMQWLTLFIVLIYIVFFAISLGPISWLLFAEIIPLKIRGIGVSIGALSNWIFNAIFTITMLRLPALFTNPNSISDISNTTLASYGKLFFIFAIIAFLGVIFGKKYMPETNGKTLESIEEEWNNGLEPK